MKGETSLAYVPIHPRCPNPSRLWVFRLFLNDVNGNGKLIANMWFVDSLPKKVLNSHEILDSMITIGTMSSRYLLLSMIEKISMWRGGPVFLPTKGVRIK